MTEEVESARLVRRLFEDVFERRRFDSLDELLAPDYVQHSPRNAEPEPIRGPDGFERFARGILQGFPDAVVHIRDVFGSGDRAAIRIEMEGTHLGAYRGLPPTGSRFSISEIAIVRVEHGKIAEGWQEIDALGLADQLGVVPPLGSGPFGLVGWTLRTVVRFARLNFRARRRKGETTS